MKNLEWIKKFAHSFDNINQLIEIPNEIIQIVLTGLNGIDFSPLLRLEQTKLNNVKKSIENISSESIKDNYKIIYNQMCILSVSSLSALLEEHFQECILNIDLKNNLNESRDIKVTIKEIVDFDFDIKPNIGKILLDKDNDINFQDLQSIFRTYKKYFDYDIVVKSAIKSNVIFFQQCRHILVHKGGVVDDHFIKMVEGNNIKSFSPGDKIQLDEEDWNNIRKNFDILFKAIVSISDN